ncbi:hypothetical protein [Methylovulum miyakonense]|uniref:hypothetical protein n=1 Tax=Methylovulum miyakonense TaxID=645578 RepID=UPI000374A367|nr:hypothetical protein [Methylovulum miyakonense]
MPLQKNTGAVRRFAKLTSFAAWLQNLLGKLTQPPFRLIQIGSAFWQSLVLYLAKVFAIEIRGIAIRDASLKKAVKFNRRLKRFIN